MKRLLQNILIVAALCGLFSQGAFAQMPGTFQPLAAVAAGGGILDCIGGTVTYSGGKTIHTFTTVGNNDFFCPTARTIAYLAVAGGGAGGGASYSGGGGAGGMLTGTASVPAATSTVIVGAGGIAVAGARGGSGGSSLITTPGGAGSWFPVTAVSAITSLGSGYTGYELRTRWTTALYSGSAPATGTQLRVTVTGGVAGATQINAMYCGHAGVQAPQSSLNYDGNQVQIKWSGSASTAVPLGATTLVSDSVNFSFSSSKDLICSTNWGSNALLSSAAVPYPTLSWWGNVGASTNASQTTTTMTGIQYSGGSVSPISLFEVFTNTTIVAQAIGGGGGGQYSTTVLGAAGGSGGGSAYGGASGGAGTAGQGNAGGFGPGCGSGGGGAGAVGVNCTGANGSNGGAGLQSSITGASLWYAAGGAGGPYTGVGGTGGSGIGGNGGNYSPATACTNGAPNTGSGGGGIASTGLCNGGSGIVVVSYASGTPNPNCIGGTITTVGANTVHTFTTSGAISCATPKSINYLVVAGGGYGGAHAGSGTYPPGGGGAGGLKTGTAVFLQAGISTVTVGAGSPAPSSAYSSPPCSTAGTAGGNSSIQFIASANGGGDGLCGGNSRAGNNGGSGGGSILGNTAGTGTSGQGNNGGVGNGSTSASSGGAGGGCSAVGQNGGTTAGANGGAGCSSSITGTSVCYAGGGAAGVTLASGAAGTATCGGGQGGASGTGPNIGTAGTPNTGGGGGASSSTSAAAAGSAGGSGIVVASYATGSTATPPPGNWYNLTATFTQASLGSGWTNTHSRNRILVAAYQAGAPATGTKIRITVSGGGVTTNGISQMWCGSPAAANPSLDFDGSQVQITFSGSASINPLPSSGTVVSDAVNFPFDKTKDLICSFAGAGNTTSQATATNVNIGDGTAGTGGNAPNSAAGFNVSQNNLVRYFVLVEVFG